MDKELQQSGKISKRQQPFGLPNREESFERLTAEDHIYRYLCREKVYGLGWPRQFFLYDVLACVNLSERL